jgi:protein TonB
MRWWAALGYSASVAVHIGLAAGVGSIPKERPRRATTVKVFEAKKEKKKEPEPEKKEAKPPPPPKRAEPPPTPKNTPPPPINTSPTPAGHEAMAALPDFGISLGGGVEGGIAVPMGAVAANAADHAAATEAKADKKVRGTAPKPNQAADACVEEAVKPKPIERTAPQYSDEARAANVEGVVKVELSVNAAGDVVDARILSGLGHGLDQAALVAAKRWKFNPATRCGKPIESKHVVSMRFQLGD